MKNKEQWKDIVDYEGMYQVSDQGRVKGLNRTDSRGRFREEKIMLSIKHSKGYRTIHLHKNGKCKTAKIHRLVAQAFLPNYTEDLQVDHINGARDCNILENLRMATNAENKSNMKKIKGTSSQFKGVIWHKRNKKWCSAIKRNGKVSHIGSFSSEEEAARAYDKMAIILFGEFARTNESMGLLDGTS